MESIARTRVCLGGVTNRMKRPVLPVVRDWLLAICGLAALVAAAWLLLAPSRASRHALTITGGSTSGLRHHLAAALSQEGQDFRLDIRLVPTAGSEDALQKVDAGQIDVALVQGGLH